MTDRSPTREATRDPDRSGSASTTPVPYKYSRCDRKDADPVPSQQSASKPSKAERRARAEYQAAKRAEASARGDCVVCCKRTATKGTRCLACHGLRKREGKRPGRYVAKVPRPIQAAARYQAQRANGSCTRCTGPTKRFSQCLRCRLEVSALRRRDGVPVVQRKPNLAASDRDFITSPQIEAGAL